MDDVRDERLGALLDGWATAVEPNIDARLPGIYRRARRGRVLQRMAALTSVALFVAAVAGGLVLVRDRSGSSWVSIGSMSQDGWTMSIPSSWRTTPIAGCRDMTMGDGAIASSVPFAFRDPRGEPPSCEGRLVWDGYPATGVAIAVEPVGIRFGIVPPQPTTVLPLTSASLEHPNAIKGGPAMAYVGIYDGRGNVIAYVRTWTGTQAPATDRADLERALRSIRFEALSGWTTSPDLAAALDAHRQLEALLRQLWIVRANVFLTVGEYGAAKAELHTLATRPSTPTRDARVKDLRDHLTAWSEGIRTQRARIDQLTTRVNEVRAIRDRLVATVTPDLAPTDVQVACSGDGDGGLSVSTPVVRAVDGTVSFRVTGWPPGGETAYLYAFPGGRIGQVPAGTEGTFAWPVGSSRTIELVCTYGPPPYLWPHPGHPLTIVTGSP